MSLSYTIGASVVSIVLTNLLNAIYYEDVLVNESNEKTKIMSKSLRRVYKTNIFTYRHKFEKAFMKVKTSIQIMNIIEDIRLKNRDQGEIKYSILENNQITNKQSTLNSEKVKHTQTLSREDQEIIELCNIELKTAKDFKKMKKKNKNKIRKVEIKNENNFFPSSRYIYEQTNASEIKLVISSEPEHLKYSIHTFSEMFERTRKKNELYKIKEFLTPISRRSYILRTKEGKRSIDSISVHFTDKEILNQKANELKLRAKMKSIAYMSLFVASWMYLFVMITDVYNKYEDNMYKISISPLVSVMLIKFLGTQNVIIFVHTLIMHFFGEKTYFTKKKTLNVVNLVFDYFVPPIAKANHRAILAFSKLMKAIENARQ